MTRRIGKLLLVILVTLAICLYGAACSFANLSNDDVSINVEKVDEEYPSIDIYKLSVQAPVNTTLHINLGQEFNDTIQRDDYEILLVYKANPSLKPGVAEIIGYNMAITLNCYTPAAIGGADDILIPGSSRYDEDKNVSAYIDLISPGTYNLVPGVEFVIADYGELNKKDSITVVLIGA